MRGLRMRRWKIIIGLFVTLFICDTVIGDYSEGKNSTLDKVIKSISPNLDDVAISATFVRTHYMPQKIDDYLANKNFKVERTTISELLVNNNGVKESVCDSRKIGDLVKQYSFHYSNDGKYIKIYDSRNQRGQIQKNNDTNQNFLSSVLSPYTVTLKNKFISRSMPIFFDRLSNASVITETTSTKSGNKYIVIEGSYNNSDPERNFKLTVIPSLNYMISALEEYDKSKNILTRMTSNGYAEISTTLAKLYLPRQLTVQKYTYDDYEGNTISIATLDILNTSSSPVDQGSFVFSFPSNAKIYDAITGTDFGKLKNEIDTIAFEAMDDFQSTSTILDDEKGDVIVSRTKASYTKSRMNNINTKEINSTETINIKSMTNSLPNGMLQMPEANVNVPIKIFQALTVFAFAGISIYVICWIKKNKTKNKV